MTGSRTGSRTTGSLSRSLALSRMLLAGSLATVGACASMAGHDPARVHVDQPSAAADTEIEPLPPSPKRRMRDPRGVPALDAGQLAGDAAPAGAAPADAAPADAARAVVVAEAIPEPRPVPSTCGSKADPCPMQRFMHGVMETAHTPGTLTSAFTRLAGMSPDPAWSWVAIATRGADLSNAGELRAAKAQCTACHTAYRDRYRTLHRAHLL